MRARLSIGTTAFRNPWRPLAPFGAALLCSCATGTGILPAGPDTYTLTERVAGLAGGVDAAQATALTKATFALGRNGSSFLPSWKRCPRPAVR